MYSLRNCLQRLIHTNWHSSQVSCSHLIDISNSFVRKAFTWDLSILFELFLIIVKLYYNYYVISVSENCWQSVSDSLRYFHYRSIIYRVWSHPTTYSLIFEYIFRIKFINYWKFAFWFAHKLTDLLDI